MKQADSPVKDRVTRSTKIEFDKKRFEQDGFFWMRGFFNAAEIKTFRKGYLDEIGVGTRPTVKVSDPMIIKLSSALEHFFPGAMPRQFTAFDKSSDKNWGTAWHQDRVIAVKEKHDVEGFKNWTRKSGTWFCEPPRRILESQVFARIHFDDCGDKNGCLRIAKSSHRFGTVKAGDMSSMVGRSQIENCEATAGDVLIAKALTLHGSKPSQTGSPRLALKIDYSMAFLPEPLAWSD